MNRSNSIQSNMNTTDHTISKSPSLDSFLNIVETITIDFEGDGNLGILFNKVDDNMVVVGMKKYTVPNEYYDLKIGMIVNRVNKYKYKDFIYENFMKLIGLLWNENQEITIEFIKPNCNNNEIYKFLKNIDCEKHFDLFENLGAKNKTDLSYIEDNDLIDIDINDKKKILSSIKKVESEVFEFDD